MDVNKLSSVVDKIHQYIHKYMNRSWN